MTNFTCQTESGFTFCSGEPVQDGTPCTQGTATDCSSGPFACKSGACTATVMVPDFTPCTHDITGGCMLNALCFSGQCVGTFPAQDGTKCILISSKCPGHCASGGMGTFSTCTADTCTQPSDPCMRSICNPADGSCIEAPKCNTFQGCETCSAGVCQPANIDKPCVNPQGDFNSCTTNDSCVNEGGRGVCMGVPISGTPPTQGATSTPTATPRTTPTATPSVTVTAGTSPTISPGTPCWGDCNHKHQVTVDNLITMDSILLGDESLEECPAGDKNNDNVITIDEVVTAEINAISGCPISYPGP